MDHRIRSRGAEIRLTGGPQAQSLRGIPGPLAPAAFLLRNSTGRVELGARAGEKESARWRVAAGEATVEKFTISYVSGPWQESVQMRYLT